MTKCADYISSGRLQLASHWMLTAGLECGLRVHDKLTHIGHARAQPTTNPCRTCEGEGIVRRYELDNLTVNVDCPDCKGTGSISRRVVHARQNTSTLWVFQRPPERRKRT
jgi:hypothetical protein